MDPTHTKTRARNPEHICECRLGVSAKRAAKLPPTTMTTTTMTTSSSHPPNFGQSSGHDSTVTTSRRPLSCDTHTNVPHGTHVRLAKLCCRPSGSWLSACRMRVWQPGKSIYGCVYECTRAILCCFCYYMRVYRCVRFYGLFT